MEGMVAVGHMAGKPARPINRNRIPGCTYTEPGIGSVGMTEAQAKAHGYKVRVGKFPFAGNSKATILGMHEGFVKVIADETFGEILGVHIIGPHAYELVSEAVTAMEAEATVETMMSTIHAHPTLYEAVGEGLQRGVRIGHQRLTRLLEMSRMRHCEWLDLGRLGWPEAFRIQQQFVAERQRGEGCDRLLFVEHPHVVTMGRNCQRRTGVGDRRTINAKRNRVSRNRSRRRRDISWPGADCGLSDSRFERMETRCQGLFPCRGAVSDRALGSLRHIR